MHILKIHTDMNDTPALFKQAAVVKVVSLQLAKPNTENVFDFIDTQKSKEMFNSYHRKDVCLKLV